MGQAFFPEARVPEGGGAGVSAGVGDGFSSAAGLGDGLGFLRFDLLFGDGLGDGVGEAFFRLAEAVGVGVGDTFFDECFRCLRDGVGLGSGSRTLLIFEPNDCSAAFAALSVPNSIAATKNNRNVLWKSMNLVGRFCETPSGRASDTDALQFALRPSTG